ncbi:MAG: hypothetical protein RJB39_739 [Candidatus Parcubacteria bacterium]|jgi:hypothetical protein
MVRPIVGDLDAVHIALDEEPDTNARLETLRSLMQFLRNVADFIKTFVTNEANKELYLKYIATQMLGVQDRFRQSDDMHREGTL